LALVFYLDTQKQSVNFSRLSSIWSLRIYRTTYSSKYLRKKPTREREHSAFSLEELVLKMSGF